MVSIPVQANVMDEWLINWNYRTTITISSDFVDSDLSDYPIRVDVSSDIINMSDNLSSIRFTDSDLNILSHEIDYTDSINNTIFWVKTDLSSSVDTELYLFYNNSDTVSVENPSDVWNSYYSAVYHMGVNDSNNLIDSTSNNNFGVKTSDISGLPDNTTGFIGNMQWIDSTGREYFTVTSDDSLNPLNGTGWYMVGVFNPDSYGTDGKGTIISKVSWTLGLYTVNCAFVNIRGGSSPVPVWDNKYRLTGANTVNLGTNYVLQCRHRYPELETELDLYEINSGTCVENDGLNYDLYDPSFNAGTCYIGSGAGSRYFDGNITEIRIVKKNISDDETVLDYHCFNYSDGLISFSDNMFYDSLFPTLQDLNDLYNAMDENLEICIAMVLLTCVLIIGCIFAINVKNNVLDQKQKKEKK